MRLAPVPKFYYPDLGAAVQYAAESSRTTHGAPECLDACRLLAGIICRAISGASKENVLFEGSGSFQGEPKILAIARGEYRNKSTGEIRGTGYVVESLEAALWCFHNTDTFEAAILKAQISGMTRTRPRLLAVKWPVHSTATPAFPKNGWRNLSREKKSRAWQTVSSRLTKQRSKSPFAYSHRRVCLLLSEFDRRTG
jgi:hypothetical protein